MKTLTTTLFCTILLISGCKKPKDGIDGAPGPPGPSSILTLTAGGFIKGTITGTQRDGKSINKTFNYSNYWAEAGGTVDSTSSGYRFYINRAADSYSSTDFNFTVPTLAATTTTFIITGFWYSEPIGDNAYFRFQLTGSANATITNFSYDKTSGLFKGDYIINLSGSQNNTGKPATISGSFEAVGSRLYYRLVRESTDIAPDKTGGSSGH